SAHSYRVERVVRTGGKTSEPDASASEALPLLTRRALFRLSGLKRTAAWIAPGSRLSFGGVIYYGTWAVEGSRTRRALLTGSGSGTTAGGVGPDRCRIRSIVTDQRVGTSLPWEAWLTMRWGGATPPGVQSTQLDLALQSWTYRNGEKAKPQAAWS